MKKENIPTIIGIVLPILFVSAIAIIVFFSKQLPDPKYDFLFTTAPFDQSSPDFCVQYDNYLQILPDGTIQKIPNNFKYADMVKNTADPYSPCSNRAITVKDHPDLYRYKFDTKTVVKVSDADLTHFKLAPQESPDGYFIGPSLSSEDYGLVSDLFIHRNTQGLYLKKDQKERKLTDGTQPLLDPYRSALFGWIVSE